VRFETNPASLAGVLYNQNVDQAFDSTVDKYLDETFRSGDRETFYSSTLEKEGLEAAEAELAEWAKREHDHRVADALEPIVDAIACVLDTGHRNVWAMRFEKNNTFPFPYGASDDVYGIVLYNPEVPGCGCSQPKGTYVFSKYGELGITSFVVIIDPLRPEVNAIVLMLPIRDISPGRSGFVAVVLSRNGDISSVRHELYLYDHAAENLAFGGNQSYGGDVSLGGWYVGFPGAQEYIASNIGNLAEYLKGAAIRLGGQHKHKH
jgi:hypothetical protein